MLKVKKKAIVEMVRFVFRVYEIFHGESSAPPVEVIKKIVKTLVEISPESVHLRMKCQNRELVDQVINRAVEKIYRLAERELKKGKDIRYIS